MTCSVTSAGSAYDAVLSQLEVSMLQNGHTQLNAATSSGADSASTSSSPAALQTVAVSALFVVLGFGVVWFLLVPFLCRSAGDDDARDGCGRTPGPGSASLLEPQSDGTGHAPRAPRQLLLDIEMLYLCFTSFLIGALSTFFLPLLPLMERTLHASNFDMSLIVASSAIGGMAGSPLFGYIADRHGCRFVLVPAYFFTALTMVATAMSETIVLLVLARILGGFFFNVYGICVTRLSQRTCQQEHAFGIAMLGAACGAGCCLGPSIAGIVPSHGKHGPVCCIAAASCFLGMLWTMCLKGEKPSRTMTSVPRSLPSQPGVGAWGIVKQRPAIVLLSVVYGIGLMDQILVLQAQSFFIVDFNHASQAMNGLDNFIGGIGIVFTAILLVDPAVSRFGEHLALVCSLLVYGLTSVIFAYTRPLPWLYFCNFVNSGAGVYLDPCILGLVIQTVPQDVRGTALGILSALKPLAFISGMLLESALYTASMRLPFFVSLALCSACALLILPLVRWRSAAQPQQVH